MDVGSAAVQRPKCVCVYMRDGRPALCEPNTIPSAPLTARSESWSLSTRYGWRKVQPPVEYLNAKAAKDEKEIKRIQKVGYTIVDKEWTPGDLSP